MAANERNAAAIRRLATDRAEPQGQSFQRLGQFCKKKSGSAGRGPADPLASQDIFDPSWRSGAGGQENRANREPISRGTPIRCPPLTAHACPEAGQTKALCKTILNVRTNLPLETGNYEKAFMMPLTTSVSRSSRASAACRQSWPLPFSPRRRPEAFWPVFPAPLSRRRPLPASNAERPEAAFGPLA